MVVLFLSPACAAKSSLDSSHAMVHLDNSMAFTLDNLTFAYPGKPPLLDGTNCILPAGSFTAVTGPSGAGKSTFLRLLCRLEEPQAGTISFQGTPITELSPDELRRQVVYIQQTPTVIPGSVQNNLLLPFTFAANADLPRPDDDTLRQRLDEFLLEDVGLKQVAARLSVGQRQRLCLIRALLLEPKALLFDEPTSALDPESAEIVVSAALSLQKRGVTVVYVAHDRDLTNHECVTALRLENGKAVLDHNDLPTPGSQPNIPPANLYDDTGGPDKKAEAFPSMLSSRQRKIGETRPDMTDGEDKT